MVIQWKKLGIQAKVLSIVAFLIILPIVGTSIYLFTIERPNRVDEATDVMKLQVNSLTSHLESVINEQNELVHIIRDTPAIDAYFNSDISDRDAAADFAAEMIRAFSRHADAIAQARIIDASGLEVVRYNIDIDRGEVAPGVTSEQLHRIEGADLQDKSSSSYFTETKSMSNGGEYISHINLNRELGQVQTINGNVVPVVRHATPIYINEIFMGIVVVNFYIQPIFDESYDITSSIYPKSQIAIVDGSGDYLFNPSGEVWTSSENLDKGETFVNQYSGGSSFLNTKTKDKEVGSDIIVSEQIEVGFFDQSFELFTVMVTPSSFITSDIDSTLIIIITVILVIGLVGAGIAFFVVQGIKNTVINPVTRIGESARTMAQGDLSQQMENITNQSDGFGELSTNFQMMQGKIREIIKSSQDSISILTSTSDDLLSGTEQINASSEEVASTSQAMSNGATSQTELISEVNEDISGTKLLVAEIVRKIQNNTDEVAQIALQTNILALNAGIEASRAGDYGRGFAVVAENVRKLSDQSKIAAEQIALVAVEIQERLQNSFDKISTSMVNIVSVSEETAASAEEVAAAAEEMTATTEELSSAAQELTFQADKSKDMISQFIL